MRAKDPEYESKYRVAEGQEDELHGETEVTEVLDGEGDRRLAIEGLEVGPEDDGDDGGEGRLRDRKDD